MKKNKSRRSKDPLAALKKEYTLKSRADLIDYDYIDKLSPEEKLWLAKFTSEEIHASVNKNPKKNKFNRKKREVLDIYTRNNKRNACIWTRETAKGMAQYLEDHKETLLTTNPENYLAVKMDLEASGWVDNEGNVLMTEVEVIETAKINEKKQKILLKSQRTKRRK